jgi:hypothetical protein
MQYLSAPVLYVGITQASLCDRLGADAAGKQSGLIRLGDKAAGRVHNRNFVAPRPQCPDHLYGRREGHVALR